MPFPSLAFIDGIGGPEMVLVFLLVLLLFGGKKLPDFARGLGKSVREFKRAAAGVEDEIKRAIDSAPSSEPPPPKPPKPAPRIEAAKAPETPVSPVESSYSPDEYPTEQPYDPPVENQDDSPTDTPADKPAEEDPKNPKDFLS